MTFSRDSVTLIAGAGHTPQFLQRIGFIPASRDNAARALASDAAVMVFPGGDFDAMRPTLSQNVIDFNGRTGYVRTAIDAGVPIVPVVSIGGQETQFFLTRGSWPAIDITARFGEEPDVAEVDAYVRKVMQEGLDKLAGQRRFPVLG